LLDEEDSGTKIKGIRHTSIINPMVDTLGKEWLMEKALRIGAKNDPS